MTAESKPGAIDLVIREARPSEAEAVGRLVQAAYAQYESSYPPEAWKRYFEMLGRMDGHLEKAQVLIAEIGGRLAGSVTFYPDGSLSGQGEWPPRWAGMLRLAVLPEHRGRGVGRALVEECIARCRKLGIETLGLHTTEWMDVARGMYERMGFVRDQS
ncbi:MAG TPA: GNAT family N-acetyltransferase, partial [Dehalococcoidia bacterium]|nr:GNAT family N-acetyltransferase [Dehalococcoidia bacterium]